MGFYEVRSKKDGKILTNIIDKNKVRAEKYAKELGYDLEKVKLVVRKIKTLKVHGWDD